MNGLHMVTCCSFSYSYRGYPALLGSNTFPVPVTENNVVYAGISRLTKGALNLEYSMEYSMQYSMVQRWSVRFHFTKSGGAIRQHGIFHRVNAL
jgi:hypothetical protein